MTVTITTHDYLDNVWAGLNLEDHQYQFGLFKFGHGTPYTVVEVEGLIGLVGESSDSSGNMHGTAPGEMNLGPRTISFEIVIASSQGADGVEALLADAQAAFQPPPRTHSRVVGDLFVHAQQGLHPLTQLAWRRPGYPNNRMLYVRCTKFEVVSKYELAKGKAEVMVEFVANDPIAYSVVPKLTRIEMTGSELEAECDLVNLGNHVDGYPPYISVTSLSNYQMGFKNPRFSLHAKTIPWQYGAVRFGATFPSTPSPGVNISKYLGLSFRYCLARPVTVAGYLTSEDKWWSVPPGTTEFRFRRDPWVYNSKIRIDIITRDTWVS